jgi:Mg2+ and Co2+ transporter CorA
VSKDDKDEYIFKLKTLTTTQYNAATRNIREVHQDIQKALEHESSEAKKVLLSYDANVALYGDKYERDIKELSERVTDQIKILEKAIESLKQGRSMGLADVKKVSKELFELERLHNHLEKCIAKYHKMFSHSSESKSSWAEVHQDLKASINVTINVDATVDEDDYEVRESYFDSAT